MSKVEDPELERPDAADDGVQPDGEEQGAEKDALERLLGHAVPTSGAADEGSPPETDTGDQDAETDAEADAAPPRPTRSPEPPVVYDAEGKLTYDRGRPVPPWLRPPQPSRPEQEDKSGKSQGDNGGGEPEPEPLVKPESPEQALEVLATLTAKPVTKVTLALRRLRIWVIFLVFVVCVASVGQLIRPVPDPTLHLTVPSSYTFSGSADLPWPDQGEAAIAVEGLGDVGTYGKQTATPTASVAKVMTAYVVLQDHPLKKGENGPKITVDQQAVDDYKSGDKDSESVAKVTEGETLTEYQALELMMLPSANNIAKLLARWDADSQSAFVDEMNAAAKELGMTDTKFTDPSGLTDTTVSTASDLLKLEEAVMQSPVFRKIVATPNATVNGTTVYNTNELISTVPGVIGVKTGSSTSAGGCLMWAATKKVHGTTQTIYGVVLDQQPTSSNSSILDEVQNASTDLIKAVQGSFTTRTVITKGETVGYADNGLGGRTPVEATEDVQVVGWPGATVQIDLSPDSSKLTSDAASGTKVGAVTEGSGAGKVSVPVETASAVNPPSLGDRLTRLG
ncbi:D-alanyl-D-alanine carboxypeptidase family protein [Streptomyces fractus]|uniref:D-alanyl-D-alanine carboxypeptidase family protein n=1 Tax=Streptomyces fractus TaxID=641806 RepID=UPI003CF31D44